MNKKGQITALLSNPVVLVVVVVIALVFFASSKGFLSISPSTFTWNGYTFEDLGQEPQTKPCSGGFITSDVSSGEFLTLSSTGQENGVNRKLRTDITTLDEILVVYDGTNYVSCNDRVGGVSSTLSASIVGSSSGSISQSKVLSASSQQCEGKDGGIPPATYYEPSVWKFKNNFDGTWSTMQYLGIGDTFIVKDKQIIQGDKVYLQLETNSNGLCQGEGGSAHASSTTSLKVYNIVAKENSFSTCKVDEYGIDTNNDGKISSTECVPTKSLVLDAEEAFQESVDAKLLRLEEEQQAKLDGLLQQIRILESKQQDTTKLQEELDTTKSILADIQAKDSNVIAVVEGNEQFNTPTTLKTIWNKLIAWITSLW